MTSQELLQLSGYLVAFLTAMLVVVVDCNSTLRKALGRVPLNVLKSPAIWILAAGCGLASANCFAFSYYGFVNQIVDLKWQFAPGRGLLVGLAVLTIIRSKFFNFKDTEVGGEYFYNSGRAWAMDALWSKWRHFKDGYLTPAWIQKALQTPEFEDRTLVALEEVVKLQPEDFKRSVREQFVNLQKTRPGTPADPNDPNDPKWQCYFRKFINLALDCCGDECFSSFQGF